MGKKITDSVTIRSMNLQNRIFAGPIGAITRSDDGTVSDAMVEHFRTVAANGAGLILQGAMCVSNVHRAHTTQMCLTNDAQIEGLRRITDAVHAEGGKIFIQLEHPGMRALSDAPLAPFPFVMEAEGGVKKVCHVMSEEDISFVRQEYISAGKRAILAGYDGLEIHASHGWLPNAFINPGINIREDKYGQERTLFVQEIVEEMRAQSPADFAIGIRMGGFDPDLKDGIENAKSFERMGVDYLDISNNPSKKFLPQNLYAPENYPFSPHEFSAAEIKKSVNIPVIGAKSIRTMEEAQAVLAKTNLDMIQIARPFLCDPLWVTKAFSGGEQIICKHCNKCPWRLGGQNCAAIITAGQQA